MNNAKKNDKALKEKLLRFAQFLVKKYGEQGAKKKIEKIQKTGKADDEDIKQFSEEELKRGIKAAHGAKLNYFRQLSHKCPEGLELYYFKSGGIVKCGCNKKLSGGEIKKDNTLIDKFKQRTRNKNNSTDKLSVLNKSSESSLKKEEQLKKAQEWSKMHKRTTIASGMTNGRDYSPTEKCGGKIKKKCGGSKITISGCGNKMRKHLQGGNLPTAQKAEERYANSRKYINGDGIVDADIRYSQYPTVRIIQEAPYSKIPATITRTIQSPGDTTYIETPPANRFRLGRISERTASTLNPKGNEYFILGRRFNTALNYAK